MSVSSAPTNSSAGRAATAFSAAADATDAAAVPGSGMAAASAGPVDAAATAARVPASRTPDTRKLVARLKAKPLPRRPVCGQARSDKGRRTSP
jgi:hypothetical protein